MSKVDVPMEVMVVTTAMVVMMDGSWLTLDSVKAKTPSPQTLKRKKRQAFSKKDDVGRKKSQDVNGVPRRSLGASFPPPSMSCIAMLLPSHDHSVAPELGGGRTPTFSSQEHPMISPPLRSLSFSPPKSIIIITITTTDNNNPVKRLTALAAREVGKERRKYEKKEKKNSPTPKQ